jgi:hypothetical protein
MTPDETSVRDHLAELLETLEAGDVETGIAWLRAAIKHLDGGEWPETITEN